jgi:hypothetical protein
MGLDHSGELSFASCDCLLQELDSDAHKGHWIHPGHFLQDRVLQRKANLNFNMGFLTSSPCA